MVYLEIEEKDIPNICKILKEATEKLRRKEKQIVFSDDSKICYRKELEELDNKLLLLLSLTIQLETELQRLQNENNN